MFNWRLILFLSLFESPINLIARISPIAWHHFAVAELGGRGIYASKYRCKRHRSQNYRLYYAVLNAGTIAPSKSLPVPLHLPDVFPRYRMDRGYQCKAGRAAGCTYRNDHASSRPCSSGIWGSSPIACTEPKILFLEWHRTHCRFCCTRHR